MYRLKPLLINLEPGDYSVNAVAEISKHFDYREYSDRRALDGQIKDAIGIITRLGFNLTQDVLEPLHKLQFVATATTGVNHIDEQFLSNRGGKVISLKGETDFLNKITPTAEHTWGLILALMRRYKAAFSSVENQVWNRSGFLGAQLFGKTIGIVGLGRLGLMVANYAKAFGLDVIYCDIVDKPASFSRVGLSELLEKSDIVSIHAPLNDTTLNLISKDELSLMKSHSVIINTARGELIDEGALLLALEKKSISGAALDVINGEVAMGGVIPADNMLLNYARDHENLIITPHIGGACPEAMRATEEFIARKINLYYTAKS